jgi:TetR/AcrR family transcriptional regulator, mexJK operon transcriptional repressor
MGRKAQVTREQVLRVSRQLFSERGYDGTTLAAIGSRMGISAAAVLRHAPTKELLFAEAMAPMDLRESLPMEFLKELSGAEDPRVVLRKVALTFVPYIEAKMGENIARWMHARTAEEAQTIRLPFDPRVRPTAPQRALRFIEEYFRRARRAGRLRINDPRSAALTFLGSLHSYVFLHKVLVALDPPIPLKRYVDTILEIWTHGAIQKSAKKRGS